MVVVMPTMVAGGCQPLDLEPNHGRHPSRDSGGFTNTKGLLNAPGQNNCFLNSAVQVLWHLDIFRRSFRELSGHACMGSACIFCALKELFSQLQFSRERALPADEVRRALAAPFCGQRRFRLGCMADAAECFENILLRLHAHAALPARPDDMCRAPHCLPHRKFAMTLVEQGLCSACGATSEPLPFTQMVHYVSASALTTQARQNSANLSPNAKFAENFGDLLKRAGGMGDVRDCPSSCGAKTQICRSLMNKPEIVSVGVVWDSERPTLEHIMDVFGTIGTTLYLKDLFHSVVDTNWSNVTVHNLVGVVTYYGKHYSTFFFHTKLRLWIYFDDATVKEVGPRWEQVVEKCRKGRYQPLLLLYSTPNGTPCNMEGAPKTIIPYPNMGNVSTQNAIRRSVTPSPEKPNIGNTRRAITPNPDNHIFTQNKPPIHRGYNEYQNLTVIQDNLYGKQPIADIDMVDGSKEKEPDYISRKTVENVLNAQNAKKQQMQLHRSLSTGSTSAHSGDGIVIPEHLNVPRRRDSGNWSGDRNSTSSSSSTTMENPYLYLVGKMQQRNGSLPSSPTRKGELSSGSSGRYDAGYDSYSLSSTDSLPLQQGLKHNLQLAQIPEYQPHIKSFGKPLMNQDDCGRLCMEADQLLDKSRQTEDADDLETALVLCNAAATKARAAMDAPYNNPHTMTFARMKHNTCIMRARSLHRRILQEQSYGDKDNNTLDIRHTREGSNSSARHSRQNSRDKSSHSRQNSKEMLATTIPAVEKICPANKNIEIYATLPKKKSTLKKSPQPSSTIEDAEYMIYDRPSRESRSIFGRSKTKDDDKNREKRSRSEDRSKISKDLSVPPDGLSNAKDTLKKDKNKEEKDDKNKDKDAKPAKKQHKIRRKLLMGGLIRRKNRSMPDLTEGNVDDGNKSLMDIKPFSSVDDSGLGLKGMDKNLSGMSGYLSEGHLEFSGGSSTNPNLERSKLMRKSFHGSAGKILTIAKVPPPPPLRTTSQLSGQKQDDNHELSDRPQYPLPTEFQNGNYYQSNYNMHQDKKPHVDNITNNYDHEPQSLPFLPSYNENVSNKTYCQSQRLKEVNHNLNQGIYDSCVNNANSNSYQTVVTKADIHQERTPVKQESVNVFPVSSIQNEQNPLDNGVDEVDCIGIRMATLELPPYPSPPHSALHSRQASEDFPPPPPPLDNHTQDIKTLAADDQQNICEATSQPSTGLLAQLQQKRQQILNQDTYSNKTINEENSTRLTGETWLKELQAKQAALRLKKSGSSEIQKIQSSTDSLSSQFATPYSNNIKQNQNTSALTSKSNNEMENLNLVKNLASKFEYVKSPNNLSEAQPITKHNDRLSPYSNHNESRYNNSNGLASNNCHLSYDNPNTYIADNYLSTRRISESSIDRQQIEEEMREVEMVNAAVNRQLTQNLMHSCSTDTLNSIESKVDNILRAKKKSVSFCDQVILVATAEDQEDDQYMPNPILERVLKSGLNKQETTLQPLQNEKPSLKRQDSIESQKSTISLVSQTSSILSENTQPEYVKIQNIYQQMYAVGGNPENMKIIEPNQQSKTVSNLPYSSANIQLNSTSSSIYQPSPMPQQSNNNIYQRQPTKSPMLQNQIQSNQLYPNNYQNPQYNSNAIQSQLYSPTQMASSPTQSQTLSYQSPSNGQLAQTQNSQYQIQSSHPQNSSYQMHSKQIPVSHSSPTNNYQQKQNSMYFPVNRTQPAYQSSSNQQFQYLNTSYQNSSNSPYQHLPETSSQCNQNESSSGHLGFESDRTNFIGYKNGSPQNYSHHSNSPIPSYNTPLNNNQHSPQYNSVYQRLPQLNENNQHITANASIYQRIPQTSNNLDNQTNPSYQKIPQTLIDHNKAYPQYNAQSDSRPSQYNFQHGFSGDNSSLQGNSPYQPVPTSAMPYLPMLAKQPQKKSVSFEPGTKGGADSPLPKPNMLVNGSSGMTNGSSGMMNTNCGMINGSANNHFNHNMINNNINGATLMNHSNNNNNMISKSLCNLCRKKIVNAPSIYCVDCDFYMSRFKPRT